MAFALREGMWVKVLMAVAVLGGVLGFSGEARASGTPDQLGVAGLLAVPVLSNVTFTAIDLGFAARGERVPQGTAIAETICSGAQLLLLGGVAAALLNERDGFPSEALPYFIGYTAWTAGLTAHGIITLATKPEASRPRARAARRWDVAVAPSPQARGGNLTLMGVW